MSFHNRHVMIKVDQNTPHHVEGRKLGKETEQLDIFKNKYVRKQTNHKYGGEKKSFFLCVSSQNLKQAITRMVNLSEQIQIHFFYFYF